MSNEIYFDTTTDVADDADMAFVLEQIHLSRQMRAIQTAVNNQSESLSECIECGADIPLARQQAIRGCQLCVDCQTHLERVNSRKGA